MWSNDLKCLILLLKVRAIFIHYTCVYLDFDGNDAKHLVWFVLLRVLVLMFCQLSHAGNIFDIMAQNNGYLNALDQ